jgi:hypothetical protein
MTCLRFLTGNGKTRNEYTRTHENFLRKKSMDLKVKATSEYKNISLEG